MAGLNIAIDFGNTSIKAATVTKEKIKPVSFNGGSVTENVVPNIIYYNTTQEKLVGNTVYNKLKVSNDYENSVEGIKSELKIKNWIKYIDSLKVEKTSVDVVADTLEEIVQKIRDKNAKKEIDNCIMTVPVNFSELQKEKIRKACKKINLPLKAFILEPVAGALNVLDMDEIEDDEKTIIVFDFGGGTLDIVLFNASNYDDELNIEILGTAGVNYGGKYIDQLILENHILPFVSNPEIFKEAKHRNEISKYIQKIKVSCLGEEEEEEGKIQIIDSEYDNKLATKAIIIKKEDLEKTIENSKLKEIIYSMFDSLLEDQGLDKEDVFKVIPIGGSSQILMVQDMINEYFDNEDVFDKDDIDEDDIYYSVALGAGKYLNYLLGDDESITVDNKNPYDLVVQNNGHEVILISKDTSFSKETQLRSFNSISIEGRGEEAFVYQKFKVFGNDKDETVVYGTMKCDKSKYQEAPYYSIRVDEYGEISYKLFDGEDFVEEKKIELEEK